MGPKPVLFRLAKFFLEDLANCGFIELRTILKIRLRMLVYCSFVVKQQSLMNIIWYEKGVVHQYM